MWLPWWLKGKEFTCKAGAAGELGSIPGTGRTLGGGMATHSSILPGESHGPWSLAGPWDRKESDTT